MNTFGACEKMQDCLGQERIMSHPTDLAAANADTAAATAATPAAAQRPNEFNLVWVDMEMTGLEPDTDRIIEVAVVVTDMHLNIIAEGPVFAIHQSDETLDKMDAWNKGTHGRSGLIERVKASTVSEDEAATQLIAFLKQYVPAGKSPMCGNTICQDRRFMARGMPKLEAFFHYRNLDVSTLKELCRRWKPEIVGGFKKHQKHTALADIIESIEELRYYREHFIKL
jgi:oligoribonuclease